MTNREYINNLSNAELASLFSLENLDDAPWDDYAITNVKIFINESQPWRTYEQNVEEWLDMEYTGWNV